METDYQRIAAAIEYIAEHTKQQPSLDDVAAHLNLSKYHVQRMFKQWAGVTPAQFMHYLTLEHAKQCLRDSQSILDTTLDVGLSSPGRLHDLFVRLEAMSPGDYKRGGVGISINIAFQESPFGEVLVASTDRGICAIRFVAIRRDETLAELHAEWPQATFVVTAAPDYARQLFSDSSPSQPIPVHVKGTNFQVRVWEALLQIPEGNLLTYSDVAQRIGQPAATRAVASAIAKNPVGYLIPCHRVINKAGQLHKYRWGGTRKKALIGWEQARSQQPIANS